MGKKKETEGVREQRWVGYGSSLSSVNGISRRAGVGVVVVTLLGPSTME